MPKKPIRIFLTFIFLTVLISVLFPPQNVHALEVSVNQPDLPGLDTFIEQVRNSQAGQLRGIYIPGILASLIVQQPKGMNSFVSPRQNVLTEFGLASKQGSTGLLAHNYLAGKAFGLVQPGQVIELIDGSGETSTFIVTSILRYQAVEPWSNLSTFIDLKDLKSISAADLFIKIYSRPGALILQTCIQAENDPSWGRLFVIAQSVNK